MSNSRRKPAPSAPTFKAEPLKPIEPVTVEPSEGFKEALLGELRRLEAAKRAARRVPEHTLYGELQRHIGATLNALYTDRLITVGHTINDKYISTKNFKDNGTEENHQNDENSPEAR